LACDLLTAGWLKVYHPDAAVLHAHDYGPISFMRRYFDDYRGLRDTTGWVEPFRLRATAGSVRRLVIADRDWMRDEGWPVSRRTAWTCRALIHHTSCKIFAALGSRADRLPRRLRRRLSLAGRAD
jgi:rhamnosyltransferase